MVIADDLFYMLTTKGASMLELPVEISGLVLTRMTDHLPAALAGIQNSLAPTRSFWALLLIATCPTYASLRSLASAAISSKKPIENRH